MADDQWIVVPNWNTFQHYRDRNPTWIKVYTELRDRDDWRGLTFHERGVLVTVWLEYARANGVLPVHRLVCTPDNRYANVVRALDSLVRAGFIQFSASKPLAQRQRRDREEQRARARTKKPKPKTVGEPRTNATAYQPFNGTPPEPVEVDEATLELARKWLRS